MGNDKESKPDSLELINSELNRKWDIESAATDSIDVRLQFIITTNGAFLTALLATLFSGLVQKELVLLPSALFIFSILAACKSIIAKKTRSDPNAEGLYELRRQNLSNILEKLAQSKRDAILDFKVVHEKKAKLFNVALVSMILAIISAVITFILFYRGVHYE